MTRRRPRLGKGWLGDTYELSCPQILNRWHFILFRSRQLNWAQHKLFPLQLCFSFFFFLFMSLSTLNHSQIKLQNYTKPFVSCIIWNIAADMTDPMTGHLNVYFPQMRTVFPQMTIQSWTSEHYHQHINPGGSLRLQWFQTGPIVSFLAQLLTAAAKSLQSCPTLCDPIDGSPPGSPVPRVLQARTLEWVAISFSNAWKRKVKVKSLSRVWLLATPWTAAHQAPPSMGFSRQEYWSGVPLPSLF